MEFEKQLVFSFRINNETNTEMQMNSKNTTTIDSRILQKENEIKALELMLDNAKSDLRKLQQIKDRYKKQGE